MTWGAAEFPAQHVQRLRSLSRARKSWSLGFVSNVEAGPDGRRAGALAWAGLGNCYYWIDREAGAAGILCAQLLPFGDPGALAVLSSFERAVYAGGAA